jgi:hypothetical protein
VSLSVEAGMTQVVNALRAQLTQAFASVGSRWMNADTKRQHMGALEAEGVRINRLDGELRSQVVAGTLAPSRWFDIASITSDGIASIDGYAGGASASLGRIWSEVVVPTASTVQEGTIAVAKAVESQLPFYALGLVIALVALAVIRVGRPA